MTPDNEWEASQIAASLTTYIAGIEEVLKPAMVESVAHLMLQVDAVYDTLAPTVSAALVHGTVNMPWDTDDDAP